MKFKLSNLLERDNKIVEKRKIIFAIPLAILFIAIIMMIIFHFTLDSALNLGTDFTGGYSVDIILGDALNDSNFNSYADQIDDILFSVTAENGKTYTVKRSGAMQRQGSGSTSSIHVKYSAVNGVNEHEMSEQVNPAIITALENNILKKVPAVSINNNIITVKYDMVMDNSGDTNSSFGAVRASMLAAVDKINEDTGAGLSITNDSFSYDVDSRMNIVITNTGNVTNNSAVRQAIMHAMTLPDEFAGEVKGGDLVGATVSTELLFNAILAVSLALIFMLCYIGLRFQLSSGLACIIALFHDIIMMFAFMAIFHIEINSTFIAALITILGYSINNSIIIFDRVRENMRSIYAKNMSAEDIANKSIRETLIRSVNTTITTLIMILMIAILGVTDIKIFAFPIIVGLISGTFSSICIAPSFWALFQRVGKKSKSNNNFQPKNKNKKNKQVVEPEEVIA